MPARVAWDAAAPTLALSACLLLWLAPHLLGGLAPACAALAALVCSGWRVYRGAQPAVQAGAGTLAVVALVFAHGVLAFVLLLSAMGLFASLVRFHEV